MVSRGPGVVRNGNMGNTSAFTFCVWMETTHGRGSYYPYYLLRVYDCIVQPPQMSITNHFPQNC
jgi:hypothetical protein